MRKIKTVTWANGTAAFTKWHTIPHLFFNCARPFYEMEFLKIRYVKHDLIQRVTIQIKIDKPKDSVQWRMVTGSATKQTLKHEGQSTK